MMYITASVDEYCIFLGFWGKIFGTILDFCFYLIHTQFFKITSQAYITVVASKLLFYLHLCTLPLIFYVATEKYFQNMRQILPLLCLACCCCSPFPSRERLRLLQQLTKLCRNFKPAISCPHLLVYFTPAILASLLFLEHIKHAHALNSLFQLFVLFKMFFTYESIFLASSLRIIV